ncbi:hypothetical protein JHU04_001116 [Brenneria sp. 4F2]|nr:hypothetical protein [Brenneria bubanii]
MKQDDGFYSLSEFVTVNRPLTLNKADYIHAFFSQRGLPIDVTKSLLELVSPIFDEVGEVILLRGYYNQTEYHRHIKDGADRKTIQFWSNMLDLTSMFECKEHHLIKNFADGLVCSWNNMIKSLGYQYIAVAMTFVDEDDSSIYITLSAP